MKDKKSKFEKWFQKQFPTYGSQKHRKPYEIIPELQAARRELKRLESELKSSRTAEEYRRVAIYVKNASESDFNF